MKGSREMSYCDSDYYMNTCTGKTIELSMQEHKPGNAFQGEWMPSLHGTPLCNGRLIFRHRHA